MPEFKIYWTGTVTGVSYVTAKSLEEALAKEEDSDNPIEVLEYPTDWTIDKELTQSEN
jgi:hypothetical protein